MDIARGIVLLAVIPASLAFSTTFQFVETGRVVVMIGCLIGGFGNGLLIIQSNTLIQTVSPARLLGRIGGIFQSTAVAGQLFGIIWIPLIVPAYCSMAVFFYVSAGGLISAGRICRSDDNIKRIKLVKSISAKSQ